MSPPDAVFGSTADAIKILAIPLFVLANAFFVAAEFALVTVRRTRVLELVQKGAPRAGTLLRATKDPDKVIAATQVGITIASLGLGWVGEPVLARMITAALHAAVGPALAATLAHSIAFTVAFGAITFLHVVLGELAPKTVALQRPTETGLWIAAPMLVAERLFRPFIWVLNGSGNWIVRRLGLRPIPAHHHVHSVDELKLVVSASQAGGALEADHGALLAKALDLPVRKVREIMVPREKVVAVDVRISQDRLLEIAAEQGYTRMPVYEGAFDRVVGIVHTKDLFTIVASKGLIILEDLLRDPYFVTPDLEVDEILRGFKRNRVHLAVVRDEFKRVLGIVTLEDVLEQLVGHIADEHDAPEAR